MCCSLLDTPYDIQTNIREVSPTFFQVKSETKQNVVYTVDMAIGRCECFAGKDGSKYWQQHC